MTEATSSQPQPPLQEGPDPSGALSEQDPGQARSRNTLESVPNACSGHKSLAADG